MRNKDGDAPPGCDTGAFCVFVQINSILLNLSCVWIVSQVNFSNRAVGYLLTESTWAIAKTVSLLEEKKNLRVYKLRAKTEPSIVKLSGDFALHS